MEHAKAHHTKKDTKEMSNFEKFVTAGNEQADELATVGAMLDEGFRVEMRATTVQQEREREREREKREKRGLCSLAVYSEFSLFGGRMEALRKKKN